MADVHVSHSSILQSGTSLMRRHTGWMNIRPTAAGQFVGFRRTGFGLGSRGGGSAGVRPVRWELNVIPDTQTVLLLVGMVRTVPILTCGLNGVAVPVVGSIAYYIVNSDGYNLC